MSKLKIFFITALLFGLILPSTAGAASVSPEFNTLCWKKGGPNETEAEKQTSCYNMRLNWLNSLASSMSGTDPEKEAQDGWMQDAECGGSTSEWGKCLPIGKTITSISLGGSRIFYNAGDYIKRIYVVSISIAGILAAVIIVIAGLEWVSSGGNSETISRAKKRIIGAVTGLVLAFGSYLILNTINPALVNLRLPQTYMIRNIGIGSFWCSGFNDPVKYPSLADRLKYFAEAGNSSFVDNSTYDSKKDSDFSYSYMDAAKAKPKCGKQYFVQGGGGTACQGDDCSGSTTCSGSDCHCFPPLDSNSKEYQCKQGKVAVMFYSSQPEYSTTDQFFNNEWEWNGGNGWVLSSYIEAFKRPGLSVSGNNLAIDQQKKNQAVTYVDTNDNLLQSGVLYYLKVVLDIGWGGDYNCYIGKNGQFLNVDKITSVPIVNENNAFKIDDFKNGVFFSVDISAIKSKNNCNIQ